MTCRAAALFILFLRLTSVEAVGIPAEEPPTEKVEVCQICMRHFNPPNDTSFADTQDGKKQVRKWVRQGLGKRWVKCARYGCPGVHGKSHNSMMHEHCLKLWVQECARANGLREWWFSGKKFAECPVCHAKMCPKPEWFENKLQRRRVPVPGPEILASEIEAAKQAEASHFKGNKGQRLGWMLLKLKALRRQWRAGNYRVDPPTPLTLVERAGKTSLAVLLVWSVATTPWWSILKDGLLLPACSSAESVGRSLLSGEFQREAMASAVEAGADLYEFGIQHMKAFSTVGLLFCFLKSIPMLFPRWYKDIDEDSLFLEVVLRTIFVDIPKVLVLQVVPALGKGIFYSLKWTLTSAVQVLRETPESIWGVATDLLWLIDGVFLEFTIEVAIPGSTTFCAFVIKDVVVPLLQFAKSQIQSIPNHILSVLRLTWRTLLWVLKEISFQPDSGLRHLFVVSLPSWIRWVCVGIVRFLRFQAPGLCRAGCKRGLVVMVKVVDWITRAVPIVSRAFVRAVRIGLRSIWKMIKLTPSMLNQVRRKIFRSIGWLCTDGLALLLNMIQIGISRGIPMLLRGFWNVLVGLAAIAVSLLGSSLKVSGAIMEAAVTLVR